MYVASVFLTACSLSHEDFECMALFLLLDQLTRTRFYTKGQLPWKLAPLVLLHPALDPCKRARCGKEEEELQLF
jgi:hypothetical protein